MVFMRSLFLLLCSLLFLPIQAEAHKIHVFAWSSGDTVTVESSFSGNKPLLHGKIIVKDNKSGSILLQGNGDDKGIFTFTIPPEAKEQKADLLIVVSGSEGHQSEWLVPATEYLLDNTLPGTDNSSIINSAELRQMIKEILAQELDPIKRSLAESKQQKPGFRDIAGGIGYLLGLAGLVAWLRNRKPKGHRSDD
jgi:nickel transport protein